MQAELFTQENLSTESLRSLFDGAMFDTKWDEDGDLIIQEGARFFVSIYKGSEVRFVSVFDLKGNATEEEGYALCNRINYELAIIRASMQDRTTLLLDWYLPVGAGIARKTVVMAFRKFHEIVVEIKQFDLDDLLT